MAMGSELPLARYLYNYISRYFRSYINSDLNPLLKYLTMQCNCNKRWPVTKTRKITQTVKSLPLYCRSTRQTVRSRWRLSFARRLDLRSLGLDHDWVGDSIVIAANDYQSRSSPTNNSSSAFEILYAIRLAVLIAQLVVLFSSSILDFIKKIRLSTMKSREILMLTSDWFSTRV